MKTFLMLYFLIHTLEKYCSSKKKVHRQTRLNIVPTPYGTNVQNQIIPRLHEYIVLIKISIVHNLAFVLFKNIFHPWFKCYNENKKESI